MIVRFETERDVDECAPFDTVEFSLHEVDAAELLARFYQFCFPYASYDSCTIVSACVKALNEEVGALDDQDLDITVRRLSARIREAVMRSESERKRDQ